MRIQDFKLESFKASIASTDIVISGLVLGDLPDNVISAKICDLKALTFEVNKTSAYVPRSLDLHHLQVSVDGPKRKARIVARVPYHEFTPLEVADACLEAFGSLQDIERIGRMPERTAADLLEKDLALADCRRVTWEALWESQQELPLGEPRELD